MTIPDLLVEQLALGELPPDEAQRVRAQLEADDDPRLATLEASDAEILVDYPPEVIAERIRHRLERVEGEPSARRFGWWFLTLGVAAAAAALVGWLVASPDALTLQPSGIGGDKVALGGPTERIKGDTKLLLYRQDGARHVELAAGAKVHAGETLNIAYRAENAPYGVIVSLDGAGAVTLHFPATQTGDTALRQFGNIVLPHAFELDDAPEFERFFFVTADEPLSPAEVMAAVPKGTFARTWNVVDVPLLRESVGQPRRPRP